MSGPRRPLASLTVCETASVLRDHFHVEEEVVKSGFKNVDGSTLSYYEEADLEAAGVVNRPLRRRIVQEVKEMKECGVGEMAGVAPQMPFIGLISGRGGPRVSSLSELPRRDKQQDAPKLQRRNSQGDGPPQRRGSKDWFRSFGRSMRLTSGDKNEAGSRGSRGSRDSSRGSRRNARLDEELRRYSTKLPDGVKSIQPEHQGTGTDKLVFVVAFNDDDDDDAATMRLYLSPLYPFEGPAVHYKGLEIHCLLGQSKLQPGALRLAWTPAQSLADAIRNARTLAATVDASKLDPSSQQHKNTQSTYFLPAKVPRA